jgi:phosphoenolpyruvate carboxykinase (ATP)
MQISAIIDWGDHSMAMQGMRHSDFGLDKHGIQNVRQVFWNLPTPLLYEEAVARREARIAHLGPLVVRTGAHTGRAANDKYIVQEPSSEASIGWGKVNRPISPEKFAALYRRLLAYYQGRDLFVQDGYAGADPDYRLPIRVVTETAWHSLFARNLFLQPTPEQLDTHVPEFTVLHAPGFMAIPELDGTRSEAFIIINFGQKLVLIGGTSYAGEIKKSIFSVMNYLLPKRNVLSMHASANKGEQGDVAIFFGLSGTGKTTLSTEPGRQLIGDDEIGWSDAGVFNIEGGCYAKVIRLSPTDEPEIYQTTRRFGTVLENVAFDSATGRLDLADASLTENTRAAYPVSHVDNVMRDGVAGHPSHIFMLTADAFGVLPPIAKLTSAQAVYHFLSGYTAKVAGTESGVTEPQATFSACFGEPFMSLPPGEYAKLLEERIARHEVTVWLVNTGWTGGPYGTGHRMSIGWTRALLHAAMSGELAAAPMRVDPFFGLSVPTAAAGVPADILDPRSTWADPAAYDAQARKVAEMFTANFQQYADQVTADVLAVDPSRIPAKV